MPLGVPNIPGVDLNGGAGGVDLSSSSSTGPFKAAFSGGAFAIGGVGSTSGGATATQPGGMSTTEMLILGAVAVFALIALRR